MTELLEVRDLKIEAPQKEGLAIPIVKGVSFDVKAGEVVALFGQNDHFAWITGLHKTRTGIFRG